MRVTDVFVEVRDKDLGRQGLILPRDLNLTAKLRWCGVGEWTLTLPGNHLLVPELMKEGSGLIVRGPDGANPADVLFSGFTQVPERLRDVKNPDGTVTFSGVTDEVLLEEALAFPSPETNANPAAQTKTNDVRTGSAEALMRQYVAYNVGNGALMTPPASHALAGRLRGIRNKIKIENTNLGRGITITKSPRFQNLLELLQEIANTATLGFRMVQVDDVIEFQVISVRDLRDEIRLDVNNGTLTSESVAKMPPSVTDAIVLGQGEGTERKVVQKKNTAAETQYNRPIERVFDRRDTNDPLELEQKADEELLLGAPATVIKVVPSDNQTMRYGHDWSVGDWITVVVAGVETWNVATEALFVFNKDAVALGVAVGDVTKSTPQGRAQAKQNTIDSRVGYLERASGRESLGPSGQKVSDWNQITTAGWYWGDGAANAPVSGIPFGQAWSDGTRLVVEVADPSSLAHKRWRRVKSAGVWGAWILFDDSDTGWVDLSTYFLDASIFGRRIGYQVMIRGTVNTDIPLGTAVTEIAKVGGLPIVWRPQGNAWGSVYSSGYSASWLIRDDGTAAIANRNAAAFTAAIQVSNAYMTP